MTTPVDYFQYVNFCHSVVIHPCFQASYISSYMHWSVGTKCFCILWVLLRHACVMRNCGPSQAHPRIHPPTQPTASSLQSDLPHPHLGAIRCCNCSSQECIVDFIKIFMFEFLPVPCAKTELRNDNFSVQRKPLI